MNSETSVVEMRLYEALAQVKRKTLVSVSDLEEFYKIADYILLKVEELRKSRDNWRKKYEELECEVK